MTWALNRLLYAENDLLSWIIYAIITVPSGACFYYILSSVNRVSFFPGILVVYAGLLFSRIVSVIWTHYHK